MSVELKINVEGLDDLRRKIETLNPALKSQIHDALIEEGETLKNTARSFAPRRTGYLESSIFAKVEEWILKVGSTAPYAVFIEFGTRFIQPRRFLARAIEYCMPSLVSRLNQAISEAIQEAKS